VESHCVRLLLDKKANLVSSSTPDIEHQTSLALNDPAFSFKVHLIKNIDELEAMALAQLVIVEVMGWRQLHGSGTKLRINVGVCDDSQESEIISRYEKKKKNIWITGRYQGTTYRSTNGWRANLRQGEYIWDHRGEQQYRVTQHCLRSSGCHLDRLGRSIDGYLK